MKKKSTQSLLLIILTLIVAVVCGFLESQPEHRYHAGDWGMFLILKLLPTVFFVHGIVLGIFLGLGASKMTYGITTTLATLLMLIICGLAENLAMSLELAGIAILRTLLLVICSAVGAVLVLCLRYAVKSAVRNIRNSTN